MFCRIDKYVTGDNVEHCTETAARKHFENITLERISKVLEEITGKDKRIDLAFNATIRFRLTVALYEHRDKFRKAIEWESFGNDNVKDDDDEE